ncbi:MAG: hypothetical protein IJO52_02720 [Clostridia bacterium]|nr:hypothetical protein [Clostridia bacterium]
MLPKPFIPVNAETDGLEHTVHVLGRDYTFGADGMITSIKSQGHELLASPMRIVCEEDGAPSVWDDNYPDNESESYIHSRTDEQVIVSGAKQSERFILDFINTVDYDGNIDISMRLMPRGKTVAQTFGLAEIKPVQFKLDKLWLEVPLRKEAISLYTMYPHSAMRFADGTYTNAKSITVQSGKLPEMAASMPFKALLWLGDEERGLGWFADNRKNWQPEDADNCIEIIPQDDCVLLRIHFLDTHPAAWKGDYSKGMTYRPISFRFGFHATPVKKYPDNPFIHNAFHLDCGIKIKGNYMDFLSRDNRFDRLVEKGVTTLILHEKWNKNQNYGFISEYTEKQIKYICNECHKRGIKVLTYFGYEISSLAPDWDEKVENVVLRNSGGGFSAGWWRVPFQRAQAVCVNSDEHVDMFLNGIIHVMDTCHTDGVYLDGTMHPFTCCSFEHGCGWYDAEGNVQPSYPVRAIRRLFKKLYDEVAVKRDGMINVHDSIVNFTAMPYIHQFWNGEGLQEEVIHGLSNDINLDYFRAEYLGRNMGVPTEMIVYANPPKWTFEQGIALSVIHGMLPRPNDIGHPLDLMGVIWKIFGKFPIEASEFKPYWNNNVKTSNEKVKVTYYKYTALDGEVMLLAFAVNISGDPIENVTVEFEENVSKATDPERGENVGFTFGLDGYSYRILYIK